MRPLFSFLSSLGRAAGDESGDEEPQQGQQRATKGTPKGLLLIKIKQVIERNYYPVEEARRSNLRHRPVGLGVQGLADAFLMMKLPFESEQAKKLNEDFK